MKTTTQSYTLSLARKLVCAGVLTVMLGTSLRAESISAEQQGNVLNLAGRQRMLSQKVSKELLQAALGVDKAASLASAKETAALFDKTLKGLQKGDDSLKLPPSTDARTLRQLGKVETLWTEYYAVIQKVIETGEIGKDQIAEIARLNGPVLEEMNKAVKLYEGLAEDSALKANKGLAVAINLSGKQRMLTQKMSKEFFLVALGHQTADNKLNLLETLSLFDRTLTGLRKGDTTLELEATEDAAVLSQLVEVEKLWAEFKPLVAAAVDANATSVDASQVQTVAKANPALLKAMNEAVSRYEALARK